MPPAVECPDCRHGRDIRDDDRLPAVRTGAHGEPQIVVESRSAYTMVDRVVDRIITARGPIEFPDGVESSFDGTILTLRSKPHIPVLLGDVVEVQISDMRFSGTVVEFGNDLSWVRIEVPETLPGE